METGQNRRDWEPGHAFANLKQAISIAVSLLYNPVSAQLYRKKERKPNKRSSSSSSRPELRTRKKSLLPF